MYHDIEYTEKYLEFSRNLRKAEKENYLVEYHHKKLIDLMIEMEKENLGEASSMFVSLDAILREEELAERKKEDETKNIEPQ